jgi:hypothetical protein
MARSTYPAMCSMPVESSYAAFADRSLEIAVANAWCGCPGRWNAMGEAPDVVFVPDWRRGNPYQDLLAKGIEATGLRVTFADYPDGEFPLWTLVRRQRSIRVVHLHWTAPYLARVFWSGTEWKARMRIISLMLDVLLVRMRGIKVFWTMHNRWSHETPDMMAPARAAAGWRRAGACNVNEAQNP